MLKPLTLRASALIGAWLQFLKAAKATIADYVQAHTMQGHMFYT